jgi:hypothetical protein
VCRLARPGRPASLARDLGSRSAVALFFLARCLPVDVVCNTGSCEAAETSRGALGVLGLRAVCPAWGGGDGMMEPLEARDRRSAGLTLYNAQQSWDDLGLADGRGGRRG